MNQLDTNLAIEIAHLYKSFHANNKEIKVLKDINIKIPHGKVFGLLGPNGAGKTTALRIIAGILEPDKGEVFINGCNIKKNKADIQRKIGYLSTGTQSYPIFTGRENIKLFGSMYNISKEVINQRIKELNNVLAFDDILDKKCQEMSTGQKQKINIARTLIHDPEFIIFDEPSNGLDILTSKKLMDIIKEKKEQGKSIFYSTHILSEIELIADEIAIIYKGEILICADKTTLIQQTNTSNLSEAFLAIIEEHASKNEDPS
ncbi:MAG: ABC transporter ATP-binding protein [Planctomycetota bacterium]|nr:MAG: ABC transporter ATP-binding protein [Planctomycetota bacterium]